MINRIKSTQVKAVRDELLELQGGLCAICSRKPKIEHLDHDHKTGAIRGTLCSGCNLLLGVIEKRQYLNGVDDLGAWLAGCATYVTCHASDQTGLLHPTHLTDDEKKARAKKRRQKKLEQKNAR